MVYRATRTLPMGNGRYYHDGDIVPEAESFPSRALNALLNQGHLKYEEETILDGKNDNEKGTGLPTDTTTMMNPGGQVPQTEPSKPYVCSRCAAAYATRKALKVHELKEHRP